MNLSRWKPFDLQSYRTMKLYPNTRKMFGWMSWVCNFSPLINTLYHWKYRDYRLDIPIEPTETEQ